MDQCTSLGLTNDVIQWYLIGKSDVRPVNLPDKNTRKVSFTLSNHQDPSAHVTSQLANHKLLFDSYAYKSFPPEVQLCWSSIPGKEFGVMATTVIPRGAWIGPYEGKLVDINEVDKCEDRANTWEVFHQNQVRYYIDGTDINTTSWLRFIQCARNQTEQNTSAFQYQGRIYYRVLRDIYIGEEILVWYDDCYVQYFGIPAVKQPVNIEPENSLRNGSKTFVSCHKSVKSRKRKSTSPQPSHLRIIDELVELVYPNITQNTNKDKQESRLISRHHDNTSSNHRNSPDSNTSGHYGSSSNCHSNTSPLLDVSTIDNHGNCPSHFDSTSSNHSNSPVDKTSDHHGSSPNCHSNAPKSIPETSRDQRETPLQCAQCCTTFSQRIMLQMHLCPKQTNAPYHCGQCPKSFTNPSDLRAHVVHHVGQKPFKCGFCDRSFVGATTLTNHVQIHMGKKSIINNFTSSNGKKFLNSS